MPLALFCFLDFCSGRFNLFLAKGKGLGDCRGWCAHVEGREEEIIIPTHSVDGQAKNECQVETVMVGH